MSTSMEANCCTVRENFSYVCGHVTTVVKHHNQCTLPCAFGPYRHSPDIQDGLKLFLPGHVLRACRWDRVCIEDIECIYCQFTNTGCSFSVLPQILPSNTWISDPRDGGYKVIPPAEIQSRRAYWTNYVHDQAVLFHRQYLMREAHQDALDALAEYDERLGQITNRKTRKQYSWDIKRAKMMLDFYDLAQNLYFGQVRLMGAMEVTCLFDPNNLTFLTHDLLHLVKPEEIPSEEICGICTEALVSPELGEVTRVFCGSHLFHHKCIVDWFNRSKTDKVSCPMCRKTCTIYRLPLAEWYPDNIDAVLSDDSDNDDWDGDYWDGDDLDGDD
ncbi:hypothetical protein OCU04_008495 [Sclerotinia nivalis]|uniref:RING-type domain-containing protein n=1 Tax=Sclerotinia nivalis TaxID=352851 RepID=A0A9X0AJ20_9HELO|nr:hypothetical protein OCU04_008495 [Sclerotinia nivalis]